MGTPCVMCGGTGQRAYFKGQSRFLLSWEDCPACGGTGDTAERRGDDPAAGGEPFGQDDASKDAPRKHQPG